jgi:O-succinylbenzoic acid--CoA ligase
LRLVRHDQETICAAVAGFQKHYGLNHINSVGVLPLYHVSGLLSWFRCMLTGGTFIDWDWKELEAGLLPNCKVDDDWVISLVPTQFQRLLDRPKTVDWLRRFRAVIVGGASIWPSLVERAANEKLPISLSYGMTETCAMISASLPENFSAQCANVGKPLPHAEVSLTDEGLVRIKSESVFKGYYPEYSSGHDYTSADLGEWDSQGNLVILGRRDFLIISGGKKIAPSEVEAALLATGLVHEAVVMGMPDPDWGQQVVAFLPERIDEKTEQTLDLLIREALASYKRPRRYVTVSPWPRNAQGKVNREALRKSLLEQ